MGVKYSPEHRSIMGYSPGHLMCVACGVCARKILSVTCWRVRVCACVRMAIVSLQDGQTVGIDSGSTIVYAVQVI